MYQLGLPVVADNLVTMGLVPKGVAMKILAPEAITVDGVQNP
jgi:hypothetical protein